MDKSKSIITNGEFWGTLTSILGLFLAIYTILPSVKKIFICYTVDKIEVSSLKCNLAPERIYMIKMLFKNIGNAYIVGMGANSDFAKNFISVEFTNKTNILNCKIDSDFTVQFDSDSNHINISFPKLKVNEYFELSTLVTCENISEPNFIVNNRDFLTGEFIVKKTYLSKQADTMMKNSNESFLVKLINRLFLFIYPVFVVVTLFRTGKSIYDRSEKSNLPITFFLFLFWILFAAVLLFPLLDLY